MRMKALLALTLTALLALLAGCTSPPPEGLRRIETGRMSIDIPQEWVRHAEELPNEPSESSWTEFYVDAEAIEDRRFLLALRPLIDRGIDVGIDARAAQLFFLDLNRPPKDLVLMNPSKRPATDPDPVHRAETWYSFTDEASGSTFFAVLWTVAVDECSIAAHLTFSAPMYDASMEDPEGELLAAIDRVEELIGKLIDSTHITSG